VRRAYVFGLAPTTGQARRLDECLRDHRCLYNAALEHRRTAWQRAHARISYTRQAAELTAIRADDAEQARWSFSSQQATLRRLDLAFGAFFRRLKTGDTPGYPRFKGRDRFGSVLWPTDGDGCGWQREPGRVYLQGVGHVKVRQHRDVQGQIKTVQIRREGVRWFVVLSCDEVPPHPLPATGYSVGLDLGVARFATLTDGTVIENPRGLRTNADRLAEAQQRLARYQRRSRNRQRARDRVAEIHRKIRHQRADFHHKTALALIRDYDVIAVEDLRIRNMTRSASGSIEEPGTNVAAKSGLNRSILDAGWGQFLGILAHKAEGAGREIRVVNPGYTSVTCPTCGSRCTRPRQDMVICAQCGAFDADAVGAFNVATRAGLGSRHVRPPAVGSCRL
jgi:putative transposase